MKTILIALLALTTLNASADINAPEGDMIEVGTGSIQLEEGYTTTIFTSKIDETTGEEEVTSVILKDESTGKEMVVGTGNSREQADIHLFIALRLKYPELLGARVGLTYKDIVELGIEVGVGIFVHNKGVFLNVYPFSGAMKPFYVGVRIQDQTTWRVAYNLIGVRGEAIIGYKYDFGGQGGFYGFAEFGIGSYLSQQAESFGYTWSTNDKWVKPVINFGVGYNLGFKKRR